MEKKDKTYDLATFKRINDNMIATNETAYAGEWSNRWSRSRLKNYTKEEIERIIDSGSLLQQKQLSRNYFYKDGFYKRIIIYYATLLKYTGILIPNPSFGKKLSTPFIQKRYYNAVDYIERINVPSFCENCTLRALIDGSYYGVIIEQDKNVFSVLDLPGNYCVSNFKDKYGNDLIEFDVTYFNTIFDKDSRKEALKTYPSIISNHYKKYRDGKVKSKWVPIPAEIGICFPMFDGRPLFLNVIPATIDYDEAVETERERDLEEIRKIIVQKVPHLTDGGLLFEPEEAEEMHKGAVGMMKGNKNISVLTSYADVDAIVSKTSADTASNNLEKMVNNIYYQSGASGQLFATNSNLSLETSIKNDAAMMMHLAHKFEIFLTNMVNKLYSNTNVTFKYTILPITHYNEDKYVELSFKLANSGYSFLLPTLALGLSQRDIINIKDLENDVLELGEKFIPLTTAYTQSAEGGPGAPKKAPQEKAPKTIQNETSLDKGGSE